MSAKFLKKKLCCFGAMKFSHLAAALVALNVAFGPVDEGSATDFQEDCAGCGGLTQGLKIWDFKGQRRDVIWQQENASQ